MTINKDGVSQSKIRKKMFRKSKEGCHSNAVWMQ